MNARTQGLYFFFKGRGDHRDLHSFPTRRSSDLLGVPAKVGARGRRGSQLRLTGPGFEQRAWFVQRSEEHTSELQSRRDLVCRLLLEKKNNNRRASQTRSKRTRVRKRFRSRRRPG